MARIDWALPRCVAISGAAGFIGLRFAELLASRGISVSGIDLAEPPAGGSQLERKGKAGQKSPFARFIAGDLSDESKIDEWLAPLPVAKGGGAQPPELVIHCAAIVRPDGSKNLFNKVNRDLPLVVARKAWERGVGTFAFLSSVMVYGFTFPDGVSEDSDPEHFRPEGNAYCRTKIEAEALLQEFREEMRRSKSEAMKVVIIRPGDVIGPRSPWIEPPLHALGKLGSFLCPSGGQINAVFVDNLLDGVMIASSKGGDGEAYLIVDQTVPFTEHFRTICRQVFGHEKVYSVPMLLVRLLLGWIIPLLIFLRIIRLTGENSHRVVGALDPAALDYLRRPAAYSSAKIRALGYRSVVPLEQAVRESTQPYHDLATQ
jgi:nucleoside-diphosphate-sugar epimerase